MNVLRKYLPEILGAVLIIMAVLFLGLQIMRPGSWYSIPQAMNHETVISCLVVAAIGLLAGKYLGKTR